MFFRGDKYRIQVTDPGCITYIEGRTTLRFPAYEDEDSIVIGEHPSGRRVAVLGDISAQIHWSASDKERVLSRLLEYFRKSGRQARVFRQESSGAAFYPELFEYRGRASEGLEEAGFMWFTDYTALDLLHWEYGLEVCGVQEKSSVAAIANVLQTIFPHWHYQYVCLKDGERDPGWKIAIHFFPREQGDERVDSD